MCLALFNWAGIAPWSTWASFVMYLLIFYPVHKSFTWVFTVVFESRKPSADRAIDQPSRPHNEATRL
jgi:hypothetical protein